MQEQLEVYEITTLEEAKILTNELRMKIFSVYFDQKPRTAKQLADELNLSASKVHYHIQELVKAGFLFLYDTNEVNGIMEKYYLPIAKDFRILINQLDIDGRQQIVDRTLSDMKKQLLQSINQNNTNVFRTLHLHLNQNEKEELEKELISIMEKWEKRIKEREPKGEKGYGVLVSMFAK
ncbi:helix-turn-helix domain-containing protein [Bacillus sp. FJAT-49736]|uniref:ArsR/SmtB family transcription factor n=1 Tax=Bacillus sp. FJAT-49736 TaxID=2833582 RepID=UPI001BC9F301|nr:helix-turn-helix domain-containing protein [Bacillus sp. FJAT-49736]MBS4172930.1 helix-turn-helix transcriptional regulator [Bacillus sp. FJAT-49736]